MNKKHILTYGLTAAFSGLMIYTGLEMRAFSQDMAAKEAEYKAKMADKRPALARKAVAVASVFNIMERATVEAEAMQRGSMSPESCFKQMSNITKAGLVDNELGMHDLFMQNKLRLRTPQQEEHDVAVLARFSKAINAACGVDAPRNG